jgi:diaminopimelate decarboxylase
MATDPTLSHVYPLGSRVNERGRLEVGGCDVVELAERVRHAGLRRRRGRPAARARAFVRRFAAAARHEDFDVVFASKAFPCTAVLRVFARRARLRRRLRRRAAPRAARRLRPERIVLHGNAKSDDRAARWRSTPASG